jgi:hypothetical protein
MGSSSYLSILYTVILLLKVWGRTVTRKNVKNSDNIFNSSTYLKYKVLLLTWMVSRCLSINNSGFDYH